MRSAASSAEVKYALSKDIDDHFNGNNDNNNN